MLTALTSPKDYFSFMKAAAFVGLLACAGGIVISPVLLSIGTFLIIVPALISMPPLRQLKKILGNPAVLLFSLIYPIHLLSWFWTEDSNQFMDDVRIKAPLFFIPYALTVLGAFSRKEISAVLAVFCLSVFIVGTVTVFDYFLHFEEINYRISIAKPVETFLGLSHIYFSIAMFAATFSAAWIYFRGKAIFFNWEKKLFGILSMLMAVYLHILTTRTGIVAFYGGLLVMATIYILKTRSYITGFSILALIVLLPFLAWFTIPSIRNRFHSTWIDLEAIYYNIDPNDYSLATRVEAWKTASHIFQRAPFQGVGIADLRMEMTDQYKADQSVLELRNQEMPHNQFLEILAGLGLLGFIPFIIGWVYPIFLRKNRLQDWLFPTLWAGFTLALMVESVLERQAGVAIIVLFWGLLCVKAPERD